MAEHFKAEKSRKKDGTVGVEVTVDFPYFRDEREKVLKELGKEVEIKGFRKGEAPMEVLESRFGAQANTQVVRQVALKVVSEMIKSGEEFVLSPLTVDQVSEYEVGKQVKFSFSFLGAPEIDTKILKKIEVKQPEDAEVSDEEVMKVLEEMWKEDKKRTRKELKKGTGDESTKLLGPDGKPIKEVKPKKEKKEKFDESSLSDDWAKKMDPSVSGVAELKSKIKKALEARKEQYGEALFRHNIFSKVADELDIEAPEDLVEAEIINREEEFYATARMSGVSPAEYVKAQNVSLKQLRQTWEEQARKGLEQMLVITGVARAEGIEVSDKEAEKAQGEKEKLEQARLKVLSQKVSKYLEDTVKTK